jgi:anti-sigma28 factor (negative regulator of flagellin synthesis)
LGLVLGMNIEELKEAILNGDIVIDARDGEV